MSSVALEWILSRWSSELASAVGRAGGSLPEAEIVDAEDASPGPDWLWKAQQFSLPGGPCIWIGAEESGWKKIGDRAGAGTEADASEPGNADDAYREVLARSFSGLATALTERFGEEINCLPGEENSTPPEAGERGFVSLRIGDGAAVQICLIAGNDLLQMLSRESAPEAPPITVAEDRPNEPAGREPGVAAFTSVLDVELPVSVSLGTTRLCLEEVVKLGEGSVIPLGREASELVIVQVNGRIVARGEVVVVRGQYGVRIQELSSLSERLEQLNSIRWPQSADASAS